MDKENSTLKFNHCYPNKYWNGRIDGPEIKFEKYKYLLSISATEEKLGTEHLYHSVNINLSVEEAKQLRDFLNEFLKKYEEE